MKRLIIVSFVILLALAFGSEAHAKPKQQGWFVVASSRTNKVAIFYSGDYSQAAILGEKLAYQDVFDDSSCIGCISGNIQVSRLLIGCAAKQYCANGMSVEYKIDTCAHKKEQCLYLQFDSPLWLVVDFKSSVEIGKQALAYLMPAWQGAVVPTTVNGWTEFTNKANSDLETQRTTQRADSVAMRIAAQSGQSNASSQSSPSGADLTLGTQPPNSELQALRGGSSPVQPMQPFGFKERMTAAQIQALIGKSAIVQISGDAILVSTAPTPNSFFTEYGLIVSPKEGLVKVIGFGKTIETGDDGIALQAEFKDIVDAVSRKYGKPSQLYETCSGGDTECKSEFWMLTLKEKNRHLDAFWTPQQIMVQTVPDSLNEGHVNYIVEFPSFKSYSDRKSAQRDDTF